MTVTKESIQVKAEPEHHGNDHAGKYLEDYESLHILAELISVEVNLPSDINLQRRN